jgi:hypothetical protein
MKNLFDQGVPVPLMRELAGHQVETAYERGWATLANGRLLDAAEQSGFDVLVTTDKNLRYQQDLSKRTIAILVLPTTRWPVIQTHTEAILEALLRLQPGTIVEVNW